MDFSMIRKAIQFTWDELKRRPGEWFGIQIITTSISTMISLFLILSGFLFFLFGLGIIVFGVGLYFSIKMRMLSFMFTSMINTLDVVNNRPLRGFKDRISNKLALTLLILGLMYTLIILIGTIFLIIPGVIFLVRLGYASYVLLEENCSIFQAFSKSWNLTKGVGFELYAACIVNSLFCLAPLSILCILFPINPLFNVSIYNQLKNRHQQLTVTTNS